MYTIASHTNRAFSLLELLIAVAIFTLVMTISTGALISLLGVNLKNRTTVVATNNLNIVLESMTRALERVDGAGFTIVDSTITFDTHAFGGATPQTISFRLSDGAIERSVDGGEWVRMTSQDVTVTSLGFQSLMPSGGTTRAVRISVSAQVGDPANPGEFTDIHAQATVSQGLSIPNINSAPISIASSVPYCPIHNMPGLSLLIDFEADKSTFTTVTASRSSGRSACYTSTSLPYVHRTPRRCGCAEMHHPGFGGNLFCPGYDGTTAHSNTSIPDSFNHWRGESVNGYAGLAFNELVYPAVGESLPALAPGEYEIVLAGWDNQCATQEEVPPGSGNFVFSDCSLGLTNFTQQQERIYAEITLDDGSVITTDATRDIPCGEQAWIDSDPDPILRIPPDSALGDYDCVNFNVVPDVVATLDTSGSGAQIDEIRVIHAGCVPNSAGEVCSSVYDGVRGGYFNMFDIETSLPWWGVGQRSVALDLVSAEGGGPLMISSHSLVPACIGFIRTDGGADASISPLIRE